jgi:hypothetical protein
MMKKLFILLGIVIITLAVSAQHQNFQNKVEQIFGKEGEKYFKFSVKERPDLAKLSRIISIDQVDGYDVYAYANKKEFISFLRTGLSYTILPHPGDLDYVPKMLAEINIREIAEWDFYPTYDGYLDMMTQFQADYPEICHVFSIGQSIQGREIMMARISDNVGVSENEPQFLYTATMHGDETAGYVLSLRLIDYLLSNYGVDDRITNMVDNIDIWINPNANPDGTYAGGNNTVNGARRYNSAWVDLNRNFPDPEDGPHPDGNEWQAETLAFMQLAEDEHFVSSSNWHGGYEICNYPWDTWPRLAADDDWWVFVCREYADTVHLYSPSNYMNELDNGITNGYAWYTTAGSRQDYMNYFHQCREFTLELSDVKLLPPSQLPAHWNYNYRSMLNYIEQSSYGLRGIVKDTVTGWPVEAEIYAIGHEEDSSWVYSRLPNGNYHRLLYEGTYNIRVSAPGYINKVFFNVEVTNRSATVLNVWLLPEGVGGIEQNGLSKSITVYPNPAVNSEVYVRSPNVIMFYKLYDIEGKEVTRRSVYENDFSINLESCNPGLHFLYMETERGMAVKRFIVR